MRKGELEISSADNAERIATLVWREGRVEATFVADEMRTAVDRWIANGVRDWVDAPGGRAARITPSSDPLFLRHLAEDLRTQFNFSLFLIDPSEPPVEVIERRQLLAARRPAPAGFNVSLDSKGHLVAGACVSANPKVSTYEWHV